MLYPFFGTLLGWLGVALTGSDTSSNVLFGSLQTITAEQLGLSPMLMAAANSTGGVMGKMIDAQSIVVASTATSWYGHEGEILRYVFFHSLALAALVGVLVLLQAYVVPFTRWWCASRVRKNSPHASRRMVQGPDTRAKARSWGQVNRQGGASEDETGFFRTLLDAARPTNASHSPRSRRVLVACGRAALRRGSPLAPCFQ